MQLDDASQLDESPARIGKRTIVQVDEAAGGVSDIAAARVRKGAHLAKELSGACGIATVAGIVLSGPGPWGNRGGPLRDQRLVRFERSGDVTAGGE